MLFYPKLLSCTKPNSSPISVSLFLLQYRVQVLLRTYTCSDSALTLLLALAPTLR